MEALGGGFGLVIQSNLEFKVRSDFQSPDSSLFKSTFAEIPNSKR